jgi:hypothetical protein
MHLTRALDRISLRLKPSAKNWPRRRLKQIAWEQLESRLMLTNDPLALLKTIGASALVANVAKHSIAPMTAPASSHKVAQPAILHVPGSAGQIVAVTFLRQASQAISVRDG